VAQILWFENHQPADAPVLGGKDGSLGTLLTAGLPVPPGFAVSADCFRKALADGGLAGQLDVAGRWDRGRRVHGRDSDVPRFGTPRRYLEEVTNRRVVAIEGPGADVERGVRRQSQAGPNVCDDRERHVLQG